jgi:hypothetical protein
MEHDKFKTLYQKIKQRHNTAPRPQKSLATEESIM